MARLDRQAQRLREQALAQPLVRASTLVLPSLSLADGTAIALSVNK